MKKDTILSTVAIIMMLFALRSLVAEENINCHENINCQECCKEGRFVSTECSQQCNSCDIYNDSAAAESDDFPE